MKLDDMDRGRDFVLRALAATEIAEGCLDPAIRQSFMDLAAHWLDLAHMVREEAPPPGEIKAPAERASFMP